MSTPLALALIALILSAAAPREAAQAQACDRTSSAVHAEPTPPSLPAAGGKLTDPTFCTTIMRLTDATDGTFCENAYSYWPTFNRNSTQLFVFCDGPANPDIPKLFGFDPNTFNVLSEGTLYDPPLTGGGGYLETEDAIWSGTNPSLVHGHATSGLQLWEINVSTRSETVIKNFATAGVSATHLRQMSRSVNDNVFAFTSKDANWVSTGYLVWQRNPDMILLDVPQANLDEVQIDKTGQYLAVKLTAPDGSGVDVKIINVQTGGVVDLTDAGPDFSPGHSDNGSQIVVGHDNHENRYTRRSLATPHAFDVIIDSGDDWSQAGHVSMLADDESWVLLSNYLKDGGTDPVEPFRQEILQIATDGSENVRRLAHHHSVYGGVYTNAPRANISRDGRYVAFTSTWGTSRRDVFIVAVPASGCSYSLSPSSQSVGSGATTGSVSVVAGSGCSWTAVSNDSWITITSGASVTGNGSTGYSVAANTGAARNGTITIAGQSFAVNQAAAAAGSQNVVWTNVVNSTATGNSLQKSGGCDGCSDAGAWSQQSIAAGNSHLEFTATEINKVRVGALTATRSTTNSALLDFAIRFNGAGVAEVRENDVYKSDTPVVAGNVFRIAVQSGVVRYSKNGTVFYTSTKVPTFPLYADAILVGASSTITNAVIQSCTYSIAPTSQSVGAGVSSGSINVTTTGGCAWTAVSNQAWVTITSGASGSGNGTVGYSVAANTGAARNGTITVGGQSYAISQAAGVAAPQNVVWTNVVNSTVTGNSIQKTAGCDGCSDAGAWSQQAMAAGNRYFQFTATEINKVRVAALTATRSTTNPALLDFAIQFNGAGVAEVRENGVYKGDTTVASGNVFRIAVESGVVKYSKNGTVFYTSVKTPTFPLYADTIMSGLNATITNAIVLP